MDPITQQTVLAAAGAGGDKVYVDDLFSTYLYTGTDNAQTITNGIDLAGEGGLVWIKQRTTTNTRHAWTDTERGAYGLDSSDTIGQFTSYVTGFNSNGFNIGATASGVFNESPKDYASWTFRKAPGFFDVVTYTGTDSTQNTQTIAHSLGSVPGMIIVKRTSGTQSWYVYHRSSGNDKHLILDNNNSQTGSAAWNDTTPTSTHFTVSGGDVNGNGQTHVAYIFAHDDAQFGTGGNESIIKCGSYAGNGSTTNVNLGFEPQWLLVKSSTAGYNWVMLDNMRGISTGSNDNFLSANSSDEEQSQPMLDLTPTGFVTTSNANTNANGHTYIYMAIRRPNKPPELATDVFAANLVANDSTYVTTGFPVDFGWQKTPGDTWYNFTFSRLQGSGRTLRFEAAGGEFNFGAGPDFDSNTQMQGTRGIGSQQQILYGFKRAPGFMDVVMYTGTGSIATHNHSLSGIPELMMVKCRSNAENWRVYAAPLGATKAIQTNSDSASSTSSVYWNDTAPTSSVFTVANYDGVNGSGKTYINHLFATLPGISKVGSYTGTGYAINVDCGFTNGARFILIKRTDSTGDWYYWDTARGIISGNDPYLLLNSTATQVTNTDYIDPLTSGFTVTASAPAALNTSGGTYLFLAIA